VRGRWRRLYNLAAESPVWFCTELDFQAAGPIQIRRKETERGWHAAGGAGVMEQNGPRYSVKSCGSGSWPAGASPDASCSRFTARSMALCTSRCRAAPSLSDQKPRGVFPTNPMKPTMERTMATEATANDKKADGEPKLKAAVIIRALQRKPPIASPGAGAVASQRSRRAR
jgi:hypothetical protein